MRFDSKLFNPQAFGSYVNRIPNVTKNELARSALQLEQMSKQRDRYPLKQDLYIREYLISEG